MMYALLTVTQLQVEYVSIPGHSSLNPLNFVSKLLIVTGIKYAYWYEKFVLAVICCLFTMFMKYLVEGMLSVIYVNELQ